MVFAVAAYAGVMQDRPFGAESFREVTVGDDYACALRLDGTVVCHGTDEGWGQEKAPAGRFAAVRAGHSVTLALRPDGTLASWGSPGHQVVREAPRGRFVEVQLGRNEACALDGEGRATCWPDVGLLPDDRWDRIDLNSDAACGIRTDGSLYCGNTLGPDAGVPFGAFHDVALGGGWACAVRDDHTLECWGKVPFATPEGDDYIRVEARGKWGCAEHADGTLLCFKAGAIFSPPGTFTQFSVGTFAGCGVGTDGRITCWGDNLYWR